ncbi:MAG: nucleoside kinase [Duncaniella sp.]|nr:nucleoside kinase [Duncaniella sp.]
MSTRLNILVTNLNIQVEAEGGETLLSLAKRLNLGFEPVCARLNNRTVDLSTPLYRPAQVEYVAPDTTDGRNCLIRSLCMLLYRAVSQLMPGKRLVINHSVARGYYATLPDTECTPGLVGQLKAQMKDLIALDIPFERHERPTPEVLEIFRRQGLLRKVKLIETLHNLYTVYYTLDDLADTFLGPLAPSTGRLAAFDLHCFEEGMLLLGAAPDDPARAAIPVPQPKLFNAFTEYLKFNSIVGIKTLGDVNDIVAHEDEARMINVAEALHAKYIGEIADRITRRFHQGGSRIVLIAGPSSSGKTTFTKRLAINLLTNLIKPVMISLDDYFVDREHTPRDADGDYDYESLHALDLKLFNRNLLDLLAGREVELPYYNFETGQREFRGNRIRLAPDSVLLIEGIHGLNPELTADIPEDMKYRVYVSALTTLSLDDHNWVSTTDNRLLRRIIRDYKYRGTSATSTIARWPSVRRGEEKWIFPYQENADSMFNSSLLFELSVMRDEAERVLRSVPHDRPEYAVASRLINLLSLAAPISSRLIPPTSLIREFLGGSSFRY